MNEIIVEQSGFLVEDETFKLLAPTIQELFKEIDLDPRIDEDVAGKLGFIPEEVVNYEGLIKTKLGVKGAPLAGELDAFRIMDRKYGPSVGYGLVRTFLGAVCSGKVQEWIGRIKQSNTIPDALIDEISNTILSIEDETASIKIRQNEYYTQILTEGFDSVKAPFGPGSRTYDGLQLFSTVHKVVGTGATYSNIVTDDTGNHADLTFESLNKAIDMHRRMTDGLGTRVKRADIYTLVVAPELEAQALNVLSDNNGFMPYNYTGGEAKNDNFSNVFMTRAGFKVNLVVLNTLNQPSSDDNTKTIGTGEMWFVLNMAGSKMRKALRELKFGENKVRFFLDDHTNANTITIDKWFGAQALYPEIIVGSKGDGTLAV